MGIQDINKTIKTKISEPFIQEAKKYGHDINEYIFHKKAPLDTFRGMKIAFDASNIMYAKMMTAHNEIVMRSVSILDDYNREKLVSSTMKGILGFFSLIFKAGITPVVVFDGNLHPYKEAEIRKRSEVKKAKNEKIEKATQDFLMMNPLDMTTEDDEKFRNELKNNIKIQKDDYLRMQEMLENLGIPCIIAPYDGEQICSRLNREGIVQGVYSTDTDNYAHGASLMISEIYFDTQYHQTVCDYFRMDEFMIALSQYFGRHVSLAEIIDLCIMHGCDYNERTVVPKDKYDPVNPYKSCGGVTALECIKKFGCFESFPPHYQACFEPLNIFQCREIFNYSPTGVDSNLTNLNWSKFVSNRELIFRYYNFEGYQVRYFMGSNHADFHVST